MTSKTNMTTKGILPHGAVSCHGIADMQTKEAVMKLSENVLSLARRLALLESMTRKDEGGR